MSIMALFVTLGLYLENQGQLLSYFTLVCVCVCMCVCLCVLYLYK